MRTARCKGCNTQYTYVDDEWCDKMSQLPEEKKWMDEVWNVVKYTNRWAFWDSEYNRWDCRHADYGCHFCSEGHNNE